MRLLNKEPDFQNNILFLSWQQIKSRRLVVVSPLFKVPQSFLSKYFNEYKNKPGAKLQGKPYTLFPFSPPFYLILPDFGRVL